jgi:hypothetical protein
MQTAIKSKTLWGEDGTMYSFPSFQKRKDAQAYVDSVDRNRRIKRNKFEDSAILDDAMDATAEFVTTENEIREEMTQP